MVEIDSDCWKKEKKRKRRKITGLLAKYQTYMFSL